MEEAKEPEVDAEMEDITQDTANTAQAVTSTAENDATTQPTSSNDPTQSTTTQPTHAPQSRKDVTLRDFLSKMDDYAPIIPDAVTAHFLTLAGLPPPSAHDPSGASTGTTPLPLARLLALATQKFVADIAADAYQYSRIRANNTNSGAAGVAGVGLGMGDIGGGGGVKGAGGEKVGGGKGAGGGGASLGVQRAGFGGGGQGGATGKTVLTMEDLGMAVQEYGINVRRGEFYR